MYYQYKCKEYLNASHYISDSGVRGEAHPHCFEISVTVEPEEGYWSFKVIEDILKKELSVYEGKLLNKIFPFTKITPTLENMGMYFENLFYNDFLKEKGIMIELGIAETPTRSYIVKSMEIKEEERRQMEEWYKNIEEEHFDYDVLKNDMHFDI